MIHAAAWLLAGVAALEPGSTTGHAALRSVCAQVVLEREEDGVIEAHGYDMGSGAWYRYGRGRLVFFDPAQGVLAGSPLAEGGGLALQANAPRSDPYLEQAVFSFVYLALVRECSSCEVREEPNPDGSVTIVFTAPGGDPRRDKGSAPEVMRRLLLGSNGQVRQVVDVSPPGQILPLKPLGALPTGQAISIPDYDAMPGVPASMPRRWRLVRGTATAPGSPHAPALRLSEVEPRLAALRVQETRQISERRQQTVPPQSPPPPGSAPVEGPVERTPGSAWGPALVVTGVITLLVGGFLWFRSRR